MQQPTIADVARAAGVSVATVSRALRGLDKVHPETRERVVQAAAQLDYIASPEANAQATAYFGEAPSSLAACDFCDDCEAFHAGDADYASKIWYWSTPIAKCLDGRTDVQCTDYSQWTTAWSEIKG